MSKHNIEILNKIILRDNAKLLSEYTKLQKKTNVEFICNCGNSHCKTLKLIIRGSGMLCEKCTKQHKSNILSIKTKENNNIARVHQHNLLHYGSKGVLSSKSMYDKLKNKNKEKLGVEHALQSAIIQNTIKETNLKKYGVDNVSKSQEIKDKVKNTCISHFGVDNPLKSEEIKSKIKQTCESIYGVLHPTQTETVIEKRKQTNIYKYGVEHVLQNQEIHKKAINTLKLNYGVENPTQSSEFFDKAMKNSMKYKKYTMPSGKIRQVQGYESFALDNLLLTYEEEQIITTRKNIPKIEYILNGNNKIYFPDIFIPHENKIIEVKSEYTYNANFEINNLKKEATISKGFTYEIWIYNTYGELIYLLN